MLQRGSFSDPAYALMKEQWLTSGNAVFRSATVASTYFEGLPDIQEWTFLALRLSLAFNIRRIAEPISVICPGHPDQVTKSLSFVRQTPHVLTQMLMLPVTADVRRLLRRKLAAAHHSAALAELRNGYVLRAWRDHLLSLCGSGGLSYLSSTRHFFWRGSVPRER